MKQTRKDFLKMIGIGSVAAVAAPLVPKTPLIPAGSRISFEIKDTSKDVRVPYKLNGLARAYGSSF